MPGWRFAFGPFVLNTEAGTLLREGAPVPVGYRSFLLLSALLDRPGEVLTKSDLIDAAWQGAVVEEANLSVQIASLRKHIGQTPDGGEWIATVPRVGYRFVGSVERSDGRAGTSMKEPVSGPSIAVLPFVNLSNDPEQEYFADGMVEEIITALSRVRWLFVIARNSSFTYKGRAVDVKQVGRELGVRYVLEGSVRKDGNRVRISGQLIDTSTGAHLWADRFDGDLVNIFDLQDQVTASVAGAIAPRLEEAEIQRAVRKPTASLDAYDYYLRGLAAMNMWSRQANDEALPLFYKAIDLDPNFAVAYGMASRCYGRRKTAGWVIDRDFEVAETSRLARRAAQLGRDDAEALYLAGIAVAFVVGDVESGGAYIDRALVLNTNLAGAWTFGSFTKVWLGEPIEAIERIERAIRLSPHDPLIFIMHAIKGAAHFFAGRYSEALSWAEISTREQPDSIHSAAVAAASAALVGNDATARNGMARLRQLMPELRLSNLKALYPIRRAEDFDRWTEALRKAGLPE